MPALDVQLRHAFNAFANELAQNLPWARENELVSLFAFGPLVEIATPGAPLFSPRQIAIECAVRQRVNAARSGRPKADVRKDLLIWPRAGQTAWDRTGNVSDQRGPTHRGRH